MPLFRKYGKDSLLLAVLAYNVGPYKILGDKKHPKSKLLQKIERGDCNIESDYLDFCQWKGKPIVSIRRRRMVEFSLLYNVESRKAKPLRIVAQRGNLSKETFGMFVVGL